MAGVKKLVVMVVTGALLPRNIAKLLAQLVVMVVTGALLPRNIPRHSR